jgi:hypothetical protein
MLNIQCSSPILLGICPTEMKTYLHQDLSGKGQSSSIHNIPKVKTVQLFINWLRDKLTHQQYKGKTTDPHQPSSTSLKNIMLSKRSQTHLMELNGIN